HHFGRREVTVAAHHDLDQGYVATDATDDVTQDLLDFLARWPLAGAQQRQHGPAGRRLEDLDRLEAVAAGMGVEQCKLLLSMHSIKDAQHSPKAQITQGVGSRQGQFGGLFYLSDKIGVALKTKRCSRFASRRSSVFEPVSLSLSMMSWITPQ